MKKNKLSIFQLIRIGFFVGIGASIPFTLISYVPILFIDDFLLMDFEEEFAESQEDFIEFNPTESQLDARIEKDNKIENGWIFLGTLTNRGEHEWDSATVQIELFDENGHFMDECDGYIQGAITPGSTHNFKVTFHSYDESDIVFTDFKVAVIGAY
jgi:hypothetical protein